LQPLISIALASYNGEKYIKEQVLSILNQTIAEIELVVSDDCSTDNTLTIIKSLAEKDNRIKLEPSLVKKGVVGNFYAAMQYCQGTYIAFADQDDVWVKDKLERSLSLMHQAEQGFGIDKPLLVFTDLQVVDSDLKPLHDSYAQLKGLNTQKVTLARLLVENAVTGCTMFFNRPLATLVQQFPPSVLMHDVYIAMIASSFGQCLFLDEATVLYRQHDHNVLGTSENSFAKSLGNTLRTLLHDDKAAFLQGEINQAKDFLQQFENELTASQVSLLRSFVNLPSMGKLGRVSFALKHGAVKGNLAKTCNFMLKL
jgi:glycosyltransferase involved in cell wall biosynthesis